MQGIFNLLFKRCSCREAWKDERLALLTQVSDAQDALQRVLESAQQERELLLKEFLGFLKPASRQNQPSSSFTPRWPGSRPDLRPPSPPESAPEQREQGSLPGDPPLSGLKL